HTHQSWGRLGGGGNAKDTFDRVLIILLGSENVSSRSLQELETNRFAKADLYGKRANICSDVPDITLRATGVLKSLTGEGLVTAENKNQKAFQYRNSAKLIQSLNKLPKSPDDTDAFFRRWFLTLFPHVFGDDGCKKCGIIHPKDPN